MPMTNALQVKSLDTPDERRTPEKTTMDVNYLGEYTIGRMRLEPGWIWTENIKPIAKTDTCQLLHVGYCVSGSLETVLDDGRSATIKPGDSYTIPPGHTARVLGDTAFEALEFASAAVYAVPPQEG